MQVLASLNGETMPVESGVTFSLTHARCSRLVKRRRPTRPKFAVFVYCDYAASMVWLPTVANAKK